MITIPALQSTFVVPNSTISAVNAWQIELPDGSYCTAQVGSLSPGALGTGVQAFSSNVIEQTIPEFAYA